MNGVDETQQYYYLKIKNDDYCCFNSGTRKSEAANLMRNIDLTKESKTLQKPITTKYQKQFLKL